MSDTVPPATAPSLPERRTGVLYYARLLGLPVGAGVLIFMLGSLGLDTGWPVSPPAALAGVLAFGAAAALAGLRMAVTLYAGGAGGAGTPPGLLRAVTVHFRAMFYHLFVPFGFGMDVAKFALLKGDWPGGKAALATTLLMDRIIGVASFALMSGVLGVVLFADPIWLAWTALVVAALGVLAFAARLAARVLPGQAAQQIVEVHALMAKRPGAVAGAFVLSLVMNVAVGCAVWLAARAWAVDLSLLQAVFANSSAFLFQVIPVQIAGAGGAEAAGVVIYTLLGLAAPEAALLVAVAYGYRILAALGGGLLDAFSPYR